MLSDEKTFQREPSLMTKILDELIDESVSLPRDSVRENQIVLELRQKKPEEAVEILERMAARGSGCALPIAKRVINDPKTATRFFRALLPQAKADGIKDLLEFGIIKLGIRAVIRELTAHAESDPRILEKALYWLPSLVAETDLPIVRELARRLPASTERLPGT